MNYDDENNNSKLYALLSVLCSEHIFMCLASEMNVKEYETKRIFMSIHTHTKKAAPATSAQEAGKKA